ncbi:MAG: hypothetical protein K8U03_25845 [Planctomycetia bacterium]|nr:hypothetical protein [Planctomycetia bacterium]
MFPSLFVGLLLLLISSESKQAEPITLSAGRASAVHAVVEYAPTGTDFMIAEIYTHLAGLKLAAGDVTGAISDCDLAVKLDPSNIAAWNLLRRACETQATRCPGPVVPSDSLGRSTAALFSFRNDQ